MLFIEFEHKIHMENHNLNVLISVTGHTYSELYGQDADGNRGVYQRDVDNLKIKIINSYGKDITEFIETKNPDQFKRIEDISISKLMEAHDEYQIERNEI